MTPTQLQRACATRKAERLQERKDERLASRRRQAEIETLLFAKLELERVRGEAEHALRLAGASREQVDALKHTPRLTESGRQLTSRRRLTQEKLRELIRYEPATGEFFRLTSTSGKRYDEPRLIDPAVRPDGYQALYVLGVRSYLHRFAFFYMEGRWPQEMDHINHDKTDHCWANLRECGRLANRQNRKKPSNNTSGRCGVHRNGNGWQATITVEGELKALGTYASKAKAVAVRLAAEKKYGFHPNHGLTEEEIDLV